MCLLIPLIGSLTRIIKSHYGPNMNIGAYLDDTKQTLPRYHTAQKAKDYEENKYLTDSEEENKTLSEGNQSQEEGQEENKEYEGDDESKYDTDIDDDVRMTLGER